MNKFIVSVFCFVPLMLAAAPWQTTVNKSGILTLFNDNGTFAGIRGNSLIVASGPGVVARKVFDLSKVPEDIRKNSPVVYLRIHIGIWDYSQAKKNVATNGLDEKFTISVNGNKMVFETADDRFPACGYPADMPSDAVSIGLARHRSRRRQDWVNISFPAEYLGKSSKAAVEIRKIGSKTNDDFVCLSVDNTVDRGSSFVSWDGGKSFTLMTSSQPEGKGELMMQMIFPGKSGIGKTTVNAASNAVEGNRDLIGYMESVSGWCDIELDTDAVNVSAPFVCRKSSSIGEIKFFDKNGNEIAVRSENGEYRFSGIAFPHKIRAEYSSSNAKLEFDFSPALTARDEDVDMAPEIKSAAGKRIVSRQAACRIKDDLLILENPALQAVFTLKPRFALKSFTAAEVNTDVVKKGDLSRIFRIKTGQVITDIRNAELKKVIPSKNGAELEFFIPRLSVSAMLELTAEANELRMGLTLKNAGTRPLTFSAAFPHIAGLGFTADGENDYFLFPWGGGAISNRQSSYRFSYGTNDAWWQMIDLFSPELGGGVYLRADDKNAVFKTFNLRKGAKFPARYIVKSSHTPARDAENQFADSLEAVDRIALSIDYQQMTRHPGEEFTFPEVCIGTHDGDWRNAMKRYAAWSRKTFPPRKLDKRLRNNWNLHGGVGHTRHTRPGTRYSVDFLTKNPREQFVEIDSYWTLSDKAPWNTSWEEFDRLVAKGDVRSGSSYWKDVDTGKRFFALNRGDYAGYNPQWGGLPALQKYIRTMQNMGHPVILYTDPVIACQNTENGTKLAEKFGVHNDLWQNGGVWGKWPNAPKLPQVCAYLSYVLDVNVREYAQWVAVNMARLCRETGADGIRLDEYGHRGYVCMNEGHKHMFGERGQNAWLQAVRYGVQLIRKEIAKDDPARLILAEFPGHDALASELDGALSYDVCRRYGVNAPFPVNIYRFYFPECKLYELNVRGPANSHDIWLWEAAGAYNALYPTDYMKVLGDHTDAFHGKGEALIPSLKKFVYVNRFESLDGKKVVYTLHNAGKFTVKGQLLAVDGNRKYFDAFTGKEVDAANGRLNLKLASGKTAVVVSVR